MLPPPDIPGQRGAIHVPPVPAPNSEYSLPAATALTDQRRRPPPAFTLQPRQLPLSAMGDVKAERRGAPCVRPLWCILGTQGRATEGARDRRGSAQQMKRTMTLAIH